MSSLIHPEWPAPSNVKSAISTRIGGNSKAPFDSFNVATHVDDDFDTVMSNREALSLELGVDAQKICWLNQVHGNRVVTASHLSKNTDADASISSTSGMVCAVMTADCLPILLCDREGKMVAAVHAGWRSLAAGIIEQVLSRFENSNEVMAYLGPAISQTKFEVGQDVRDQFQERNPKMKEAFIESDNDTKYFADLYKLAKIELNAFGVSEIYGGDFCTYSDKQRFYSYRRDGKESGRMVSLIWLATTP